MESAVRELGYTSNAFARSLKGKRSKILRCRSQPSVRVVSP
jgi:DNA-binding LacI/PurR family transcriptional regulator